jgi:hypothetical protein
VQCPGAEGARGVVRPFGLHSDDPAPRREGAGSDGAPGEESSAAAADEEQVERSGLLEEFLRRRALAGDHVGMVVGWDDAQATLARDLRA